MRNRKLVSAVTFALFATVAGCGGMATPAAVPAAPSGLTAALLDGGAHLTWMDNSDDETQFMIMRMDVNGSADYAAIATPPFDTTQYHDIAPAGKTYMYMVMAMNDVGMSDPSNEVMIAIP